MAFPYSDLLLAQTFAFSIHDQIVSLIVGFNEYIPSSLSDNLIDYFELRAECFVEKHLSKDLYHWNYLKLRMLNRNPSLSETFWRRHFDLIEWDGFGSCQKLSELFVEEHLDKFNWYNLSMNSNLPLSFFEKHLDKINWGVIVGNKAITDSFIEEHSNKFDITAWHDMSSNPSLSVDFFIRHLSKLDTFELMRNPTITSNKVIQKYGFSGAPLTNKQILSKIKNGDTLAISGNSSLTPELIEKYSITRLIWNKVCLNRSMTDEFFENHLDKLDWRNVAINPSISFKFYARHIKNVKHYICQNPLLYDKFMEQFTTTRQWTLLIKNTGITTFFLERHLPEIDGCKKACVFTNSFMPKEKLERFIKYLNIKD